MLFLFVPLLCFLLPGLSLPCKPRIFFWLAQIGFNLMGENELAEDRVYDDLISLNDLEDF